METPPDYVNDAGIKWWYNTAVNDYIKFKGITDLIAWRIEYPNKASSVVLVCDSCVVAEGTGEEIAVKLDIIKFMEMDK